MQGTAPCCVRRGLALNGSLNRTLLSGHTWEQPRSPRGHEQLLKHVCPCRGSGCRKCLVLSLLQEGSRGTASVRWEQVDDLLSLVVELKEEVERLRSIWDCGKRIDRWSCARLSLQEGCGENAPQAVGDDLLSTVWWEGATSKTVRDGNKSLFGATSGLTLSLSHLPRCPYITGMRPWSWRDRGMWMSVKVHQCRRDCQGQVRLLPILLQHPSREKEELSS